MINSPNTLAIAPSTTLRAFVESQAFTYAITAIIAINAITLGLETSPRVMAAIGPWRHAIDTVALWIFTLELGLKLTAWRTRFFRDGWNIFDLVIVATGILHDGKRLRPEKRMQDLDAEAMAEVFRINTIAPAIIAKHFLPLMRRDEKTAFAAISARVGSIGDNRLGGWASYRASKAALNHMTRSLALEWAPAVRVNAIMPAVVDTPIHKGRGMSAEDVAGMGGMHPLGRVGQPRDIAGGAVFLASDESDYVTGDVMVIDGGWTLT